MPDQNVRTALPRCSGLRTQVPGVPEMTPAHDVLHNPKHHPDAGRAEAKVPVDVLTEKAANKGPGKTADIDPHVEDGESSIAASSALGVQISDDRTDIGLEQARSKHDHHEPHVKRRRGRDGQREVTSRDDDASPQHGTTLSQQSVGNPAARQRDGVDSERIQTVNGRRRHVRQPESTVRHHVGHKQDKEGAHPVVAEALPHLGKKQRRQTARVSEPFLL